jgi:hypothetical protein
MTIRKVQIGDRILSYAPAMKGDWLFKASVYQNKQILLTGFNTLSGDFFTRCFSEYDDAVKFLEMLTDSYFPHQEVPPEA